MCFKMGEKSSLFFFKHAVLLAVLFKQTFVSRCFKSRFSSKIIYELSFGKRHVCGRCMLTISSMFYALAPSYNSLIKYEWNFLLNFALKCYFLSSG